MSDWSLEIQKAEGILGDVDSVIQKGLGIFDDVRTRFFPASTNTPVTSKLPDTTDGQPEPVASRPIVQGSASLGGSGTAIIAALIIGYLIIARK